ncbi:MAG: carboxymuconolactone decarboxylase family protein [Solirubrobacteraceae bacterium]|nr:carboxymuconolactone decarboxylase family protein [Solirubrobacteraceae bacterium]
MARIEPVPATTRRPLTRLTFAMARRRFAGKVPEPMRVAARHPQIYRSYLGMEMGLDKASKVEFRLKELASIKAAAMTGCEYCIDIGSWFGREHGVTEQQLLDLPRYRESPAFDEVERLVLDLAVGMTRTPVDVSEQLIEDLREHFTDEQVVELCGAIAVEQYRARFNWALGIGSEGYSEGAVCARPETASLNGSPAPAPIGS